MENGIKVDDNWYKIFEDTFRGSRELISERLQVYIPFLNPLKQRISSMRALDLGCGRGEWLQLLKENQFDVVGIDLDKSMVESCCKVGLNAYEKDAIEYIQSVPTNSIAVVSAFHLIEHIPFDKLNILIQHAFRILVPGGILILETPNAENLIVASHDFYLDPTHNKPIPADLLDFLTLFNGFSRSKILYLQEDVILDDDNKVSLWDVLSGASRDYGMVAQKDVDNFECREIDLLFEQDYGARLNQLAQKFQTRLDGRLNNLDGRLNNIEHQLQALYSSRSWRITRPLRFFGRIIRRIRVEVLQNLNHIMHFTYKYIRKNPRLKKIIMLILNRSPRLKSYIYHYMNITSYKQCETDMMTRELDLKSEFLPSEVCDIYRDLLKNKSGE